MRMARSWIFLFFISLAPLRAHDGPVSGTAVSPADRPAPLFDNLGKYHHAVTTKSKDAQRYFDQGLTLLYGFNHAEAIRSFEVAGKLDPDCAMAWWGVALAYGPNINKPMDAADVPKAWAALRKARGAAPKASELDRAFITALSARYVEEPEKDRSKLDTAYATAMRDLVKRFPDDVDAAVLCAESLMDTMPWNYWTKEGKPNAATSDVLTFLESAIKRSPDHPGAHHYYIHAVENSPAPERGLPSAHRLSTLCPGAGHLVHMPAHIYLRLGDYHAAVLANEQAIVADEAYITHCKVQGFYPTAYYSHNVHFLWYALAMEGRSAESIREGIKAAAQLKGMDLHDMPDMQWIATVPTKSLLRFGRWDDILRQPQPPRESLYENAIWHYARGVAFVRTGKLTEATDEADKLAEIAGDKAIEKIELPNFPGASLIRLAHTLLAAELNGHQGQPDAMLKHFEDAVKMQDDLPYMEPPFWFYATRQSLGAALLRQNQAERAAEVFREDLRRHPRNGWSLFGLLQSLRVQGKATEALVVEQQFRDAWKFADFTLTAAAF